LPCIRVDLACIGPQPCLRCVCTTGADQQVIDPVVVDVHAGHHGQPSEAVAVPLPSEHNIRIGQDQVARPVADAEEDIDLAFPLGKLGVGGKADREIHAAVRIKITGRGLRRAFETFEERQSLGIRAMENEVRHIARSCDDRRLGITAQGLGAVDDEKPAVSPLAPLDGATEGDLVVAVMVEVAHCGKGPAK
jgi:hypothetical protein